MEYLKTQTKGVYVKFDPTTKTATVIDKAEAEKTLQFYRSQLDTLPETLSDKDLLVWAKEHYPQSETGTSRKAIEIVITRITTDIEKMK